MFSIYLKEFFFNKPDGMIQTQQVQIMINTYKLLTLLITQSN